MGGHPDDGDVHLVARNEALVVRARVLPGNRNLERNQDLPRREHAAAWSSAKILYRDLALAVRPGDVAHSRVGNQAGDRVRAGRGVAQIAAKGGAALYLDAADNGSRIDEPRVSLDDFGVIVHAPARHARADDQSPAGAVGKLVGFGDVLDVDDAVGRKTIPAQLDDQVGAASEDAGGLALLGLEGHGLAQRAGGAIGKIFQGKTSLLVSSDRCVRA